MTHPAPAPARLAETLAGYVPTTRQSVWLRGGSLYTLPCWTPLASGTAWQPAEHCLVCAPTGDREGCDCSGGYRDLGPVEVAP